jgi:hypothetical protein
MDAIKTLKTNYGIIDLMEDTDGRFRWYAKDGDTEVSGATMEDATEQAYSAWPEIEQLN